MSRRSNKKTKLASSLTTKETLSQLPLEIHSMLLTQYLVPLKTCPLKAFPMLLHYSHISRFWRTLVLSTPGYWIYINLPQKGNPGHSDTVAAFLKQLPSSTTQQIIRFWAKNSDLVTLPILKDFLPKCPMLEELDLSHARQLHPKDLLPLLKFVYTEKQGGRLSRFDFLACGRGLFKDEHSYFEFWFSDMFDRVKDMRAHLENVADLQHPLVLNPSLCPICQSMFSEPSDIGLNCLKCVTPILWACEDCEEKAYRICTPCADKDEHRAINTVGCYTCVRGELCVDCLDWECTDCRGDTWIEGVCPPCLAIRLEEEQAAQA